MRLKLELDEFKFATTMSQELGKTRWLIVEVGGKKFYVQRNMDLYPNNPRVDESIDRLLIEKMEAMLQKVLFESAAAVPDGPIAEG